MLSLNLSLSRRSLSTTASAATPAIHPSSDAMIQFAAPNADEESIDGVKKAAETCRKSILKRIKSEALLTGSFFAEIPDMLLENKVIAGSR